MRWYSKLFQKKVNISDKKRVTELTEFELSESHKIVLGTESIVEDLLEHISEQQQLILQYEEELRILRFGNDLEKRTIKIIEKGDRSVS